MRKNVSFIAALIAVIAISVACAPAAPPAPPAPPPVAPAPTTAAPAAPTAAAPAAATTAPTAAPAANAPSEIVFGAALPLTGSQANPGGEFKKAYELYQKEVNAAGGINVKEFGKKIPLKLVIYDDKSDNATSVQMYEKLATEDKVNFFLGGYSTALVQAQTVVPEKYGIPYVNGGGATNAGIYDRGFKNIFGLLADIAKLSNTLSKWMIVQQDAGKLPKPLKLAIIGENSSHGVEFRKGFQDAAKAAPDRFQIVLDEAFELNLKDADPIMQKVKAANADVYIADAREADYTTLHKRYTELGLYHLVVSYGPRGTEKTPREALGAASNYIIAATWWDKSLKDAQSQAFLAKFKAAYSADPDSYYAGIGYETERTLVTAIETAGTLDRVKVRDALTNTNITPSLVVGGVIKFGPSGQIQNDYMITQNKTDGTAVIIYPPSLAQGEPVVPFPKK